VWANDNRNTGPSHPPTPPLSAVFGRDQLGPGPFGVCQTDEGPGICHINAPKRIHDGATRLPFGQAPRRQVRPLRAAHKGPPSMNEFNTRLRWSTVPTGPRALSFLKLSL